MIAKMVQPEVKPQSAEGSLCDVVITVDGVEFNAHKNDLCVCSSYFWLCPENCVGIWMRTDTINSPDLRSKAELYTLRHFEAVARVSEEFLELSLPQLADVIQRDDLNARGEEVVFEAVIRWVQHSAEERSANLPLLLSKVRMALMPYDYIINHVKNNALVDASRECEPILATGLIAMYRRHLHLPSFPPSNPLSRPRLLTRHGELGRREDLRRKRRALRRMMKKYGL